jgi:hypothetical protein
VQNPAIYATLAFSSNYYPKDSSGAFQNRLLHFKFDKTVFTTEENERFNAGLTRFEKEGTCTAWIKEIIGNRQAIEEYFIDEYKSLLKFLKESSSDYQIDSRMIANYAMITAVGRILTRQGVSFGMNEKTLAETARNAMIRQFTSLQSKTPLHQFWDIVKNGIELGEVLLGVQIDYLANGYVSKSSPEKQIPGEVIVIDFGLLWRYYAIEAKRVGIEPEREQDLRSELERSSAYVKEEVDGLPISKMMSWRFSVSPEQQITESEVGQSKRYKITRAYALKLEELEKDFGFYLKT